MCVCVYMCVYIMLDLVNLYKYIDIRQYMSQYIPIEMYSECSRMIPEVYSWVFLQVSYEDDSMMKNYELGKPIIHLQVVIIPSYVIIHYNAQSTGYQKTPHQSSTNCHHLLFVFYCPEKYV